MIYNQKIQKFYDRKITNIILSLFVFSCWWIVVSNYSKSSFMATPYQVWGFLTNKFSEYELDLIESRGFCILLSYTANTLLILLIALVISIFIGYILGQFMSRASLSRFIFYPIMNGLRSLPIVIVLPWIIEIFSLKGYLIPMLTLPGIAIISVNLCDATKITNRNRLAYLNLLNFSKSKIFRYVLFWETLPSVLTSIRIVLNYTLALHIAIDYFQLDQKGLGYFINTSFYSLVDYHNAAAISGILMVIILGAIINFGGEIIEKKVILWKIKTVS